MRRTIQARAVFTKQESLASQMTAVKVLVVISKLPGCAGQQPAQDPHPVKMEDALNKFKLPELECPIVWIRLHRWKRQFEEVSKEDGWEKVSGWECLFWNRQEGRFLSEYMDDIEIAGKKAILKPIWIDDDETNRSGGTNCSIVPAVIQDPKSFL